MGKEFWARNRARYDGEVRAPFEALLAELAPEFGDARVFRPYRDVRFAKDKSPYHLHVSATIDRGPVSHYVALKYDSFIVGVGAYGPTPEQLRTIRAAIDDPRRGELLQSIVDRLEAAGMVWSGEALSTAPRGYGTDHPRIRLLRARALVMARSWPLPGWVFTGRAVDEVRLQWRAAAPLADWLQDVLA
ncbi:MAG: DUF2461 domain-containing protein [Sporichthyaceae bacterium]